MKFYSAVNLVRFIANTLYQRWTWVGFSHGLGSVGLDRLNRLAASKVDVVEMVRWGLRAGLL